MRRFDRLFDVIVGCFGILFSLQTADSFVADLPSLSKPVGVALITLVVGSVLAGLGPVVAPHRARVVFVAGAAVYGVALLLWPLVIRAPISMDPMPWVIAVWPVAAAYLARGVRSRIIPIVIAVAVSTASSLALHFRGGINPADVAVNSMFMTGIALALVLLLGTASRGVAVAAEKQQHAVDRFAATQLEDATEDERKRTDALLHDAVLTTFLSAAAADDQESEDLASRMAANALRVLLHVNGVGRDGTVLPFGQIVAAHREELGIWLKHVDTDLTAAEVVMLPEGVAHALVAMLLESVSNSVRHAEGATRRTVRAHPLGPDGIRVVIEDDGCGFDPVRLRQRGGGRGSELIRELRALEGRVDTESAPGTGTRVALSWGSVSIVGTELFVVEERAVLP